MESNSRLLRIALILGIIVLLIVIFERLWAFGQFISSVVSMLAGAWFLAFIVKGPIDYLTRGIVPARATRWIEARGHAALAERLQLVRLPLGLAVPLVYGVVLFLAAGAATIATVTLIPQATDLIRRLPEFIALSRHSAAVIRVQGERSPVRRAAAW